MAAGIMVHSQLRRLATIYEFPVAEAPKLAQQSGGGGGRLSCNFDTVSENCAWYTIPLGVDNKEIFRRARFETFFDWEKFDCTSDRTFTFEEYFLVIGGRQNTVREISGAIETRIPCQLEKAMLRFDYWANNETPVLKICVVPEEDPRPQCEETKLDANPLTFEIPESMKPFRLRIQVDHIGGQHDIAFIDNVHYDGKLCEIAKDSASSREEKSYSSSSSAAASAFSVDYEPNDTEKPSKAAEERKQEKDEPSAAAVGNDVYSTEHDEHQQQQLEEKQMEEEEELHEGEIRYSVNKGEEIQANKQRHFDGTTDSLCRALNCDFNFGDACEYSLVGQGSSGPWKFGTGPVGNPHTGIHKGGPTDTKLIGYVFAGSNSIDSNDKVFVMESPPLAIGQSMVLSFDLFQRSVGPLLKVCLNTLDNCPYVSPSKPSKSKYWLSEQRVILRQGTEKVLFVASKLRQNLYVAIDNIQLQTIDFKEICPRDRLADIIK